MTKVKVVFADGCFDGFDGTQEELQELIADLHNQIENGTLFDNAIPVPEDEASAILDKIENKSTRQ
jgi:hypothetical protein